jgi:hypothetical protein
MIGFDLLYVKEAARLLKMSIIHVENDPVTLEDGAFSAVAEEKAEMMAESKGD